MLRGIELLEMLQSLPPADLENLCVVTSDDIDDGFNFAVGHVEVTEVADLDAENDATFGPFIVLMP